MAAAVEADVKRAGNLLPEGGLSVMPKYPLDGHSWGRNESGDWGLWAIET